MLLLVAGAGQHIAPKFEPDPIFPIGPISASFSHRITKLGHVATVLAGRRAVVNCWSTPDWTRMQEWQRQHHHSDLIDAAGVTFLAKRRIQLSPEVCQALSQVVGGALRQPLYTAWAITVLAHESAHASGIAAEQRAECRAIITEPRAARLFGVSKALARRLQHIYRGTVYPDDVPRYRTPPCPAGRPGALVPDTLGAPADVRRLEQAAKRVASALPRWKNVGGAAGIGPLSPCAPVTNRTTELARFDYALFGPQDAYVAYTSVTVRTQGDFAAMLARYEAFPRCDLRLHRQQIRERHATDTISLAPMPTAITSISPQVRSFRFVLTAKGEQYNLDRIAVLNSAERSMILVSFSARVGLIPTSAEVRAAAAVGAAFR